MAERIGLSPTPLPRPLSSFVGRRSEIAELKSILARTRLLTLTGPGGCGKTRLAIELASEGRSQFPQGIAFVDLAPVRDPATVPESVATSLGLSGQNSAQTPPLMGD